MSTANLFVAGRVVWQAELKTTRTGQPMRSVLIGSDDDAMPPCRVLVFGSDAEHSTVGAFMSCEGPPEISAAADMLSEHQDNPATASQADLEDLAWFDERPGLAYRLRSTRIGERFVEAPPVELTWRTLVRLNGNDELGRLFIGFRPVPTEKFSQVRLAEIYRVASNALAARNGKAPRPYVITGLDDYLTFVAAAMAEERSSISDIVTSPKHLGFVGIL